LFSGMLGASLAYGVNKSKKDLDKSINALIEYLEQLKNPRLSGTQQQAVCEAL